MDEAVFEWKAFHQYVLSVLDLMLPLITYELELDILVTNPEFHGRGAGSTLLSWGVEQANQHQVVVALEATPAGLSLYKRFGFQEVDVIKADMKQFGWDKPYDPEAAKRVWMLREPQPMK